MGIMICESGRVSVLVGCWLADVKKKNRIGNKKNNLGLNANHPCFIMGKIILQN
jgi:hypothetical protein